LHILANMMRGLFAGLVLENGSHAATTEHSADLLIVFLEDLMNLGTAV